MSAENNVENDKIRFFLLNNGNRLTCRYRLVHAESFDFKKKPQDLPDSRLIIHKKDAKRLLLHGRTIPVDIIYRNGSVTVMLSGISVTFLTPYGESMNDEVIL